MRPCQKYFLILTRAQEESSKEQLADYYEVQGAFSGTENQTGPPVDLSIAILGMDWRPSGRYACSILEGFTKAEFYSYQINGAVDLCLKTFGSIPLPESHANKPDTHTALSKLPHTLRTFGGFLRDQTGLGKTKLILLMLALNARHGTSDNRPILILAPASLVKQWAKEIHDFWPGFTLWLLYAESELDVVYHENVITGLHLKDLRNAPERMRFVFDKQDQSDVKRSHIVLSSYESFGSRSTSIKVVKNRTQNGKLTQYKKYITRLDDCFATVVADEGHKAKNRDTRIHASIQLLRAPHIWIVTATPMQNTEQVRTPFKSTFELHG